MRRDLNPGRPPEAQAPTDKRRPHPLKGTTSPEPEQ